MTKAGEEPQGRLGVRFGDLEGALTGAARAAGVLPEHIHGDLRTQLHLDDPGDEERPPGELGIGPVLEEGREAGAR